MRINLTDRLSKAQSGWAGLFGVTFILGQLYMLMEWGFLITRPSYLDVSPWSGKLLVLLFSAALMSALSLLGLGALVLAGRLVGLRRVPRLFFWLASLLPAGMLAVLALLLIDNFTYTLFAFGIATTPGAWRGLYAALFALLLAWADWEVLGVAAWLDQRRGEGQKRPWLWVGIATWVVLGLVVPLAAAGRQVTALEYTADSMSSRPHILWITGDGLSAEHMSLYGYQRDTTPNLRQLAESSLVAENFFVVADKTAGSLVSMFTGKHPLETRMLYPPDILIGADAYQHLPGILHAQGYRTIQYGFPYYVDAYYLNLLDGFDSTNGRALPSSPLYTGLKKALPSELAYFLYETSNRAADRLRHIFFIEKMQNPLETMLNPAANLTDQAKLDLFLSTLAEFDQPTFIHLHLLGTHGPVFRIDQKVFSRGQASADQGCWNTDFYDDAILGLDANIARVVQALEEQGLLENTLLIIGSDHATDFENRQRVPLMIRFPGGEITGRIQTNVSGLDIAPTILDYLDLPQPEWMRGRSLLAPGLEQGYIFGVGVGPLMQSDQGLWITGLQRSQPPFYQFGTINLIDCNRWYELDLDEPALTSGEVAGHTAPCPDEAVVSQAQAYALMLAYLREHGFAVESLEGLPGGD